MVNTYVICVWKKLILEGLCDFTMVFVNTSPILWLTSYTIQF